MPNVIQQYINDFLKLIDKAYKEGWLYYILGVLILIVLMVTFFS